MQTIKETIPALSSMKKYPSTLFFSGNKELLKKTKISIVGTRKPSKYTREVTYKLASTLAKHSLCVVSGGAMGVDAIAHSGAGSKNTIAVLPCGIDIKYPAVNKSLLKSIEEEGLLLSQFEIGFKSRPWSFVTRNELVVALGDVLIVCEADLKSGSMRSVEYARTQGKKIFVLPHHLGESMATNELLKSKKAEAIYDIDAFVAKFSDTKSAIQNTHSDAFLEFCKTSPSYDEALLKFPNKVFEAELNATIEIINGQVFLK
ncbi:DNA-protecting protein DprA [Sulfurimonas sp. SAG-AH-194-I05]|nr:DNA-processing protein DprA [Sulfurimonas sp. SAG-AH-194-I05]MDF1875226.1 DNA-protecting protein DprA [Sulfurimonas sp. SAG-AH-194-I05]